ncbi:hypothetical protein Tco_0559795 [Tanacetum coccineum]
MISPATIFAATTSIDDAKSTSIRVTGSSAQQPFISGFPTNQPMHPQMSQQSMFGLGPRLPLSAINLSSSLGSHPMLRPVSGSRTGFEQ